MGKSSTPQAPDPYKTANAQSQADIKAIQESAKVNAVDQYAPWGSTVFTRDANGVPTKQTINLGPAEQQFYNTSNTIKNSLAGKAQGLMQYLPTGQFTGPDNGAGDKVAQTLYERKYNMIAPELQRADDQIKLQLSERGIPIGSEIYNDEMNRLNTARSNTLASIAQDATLASGNEYDRQLANMLTIRNQPFNEVSAFLQGAPAMPTPQFQGTPAYQVQAPDIAGLINQNYQNQVNAANANNSSLSSGLFGIGSALLGALPGLSDRRFKTDIKRVGKTDDGLPVYTFRYIAGGPVIMGVMADEVETVKPEAVHNVGGVSFVDYALVS